MLEKIFVCIVITSLIGTLLSVVLWLLKPLTRKAFSASWNYYIWVCVLAVMIIPLRVTLPEKNPEIPAETTVAVQTQQSENAEDVQIRLMQKSKQPIPTRKLLSGKTLQSKQEQQML